MRLPLEPDLHDRRHVERVFRDLAGIASATDGSTEPGRHSRQVILMWLSDLWVILRGLEYDPHSLLEMLGELPLPERKVAGLDQEGGGRCGKADEPQDGGARAQRPVAVHH